MGITVKFCSFLLAASVLTSALSAATCESLAGLKLPDTSITLAQRVPAGTFIPSQPFPAAGPRGGRGVVATNALPDFCRVAAVIKPSTDSEIKVEVWLPGSGWNGKFMGVGNGGFGGSINYPYMSEPLSLHYATASTDTGHEGAGLDASFALGHPERLIDFANRAVHEMTAKAKLIIEAYYGKPPSFSYWNGCSLGGGQGLVEARRFPADYNAIVAGAASNFLTHLTAAALWRHRILEQNPDGLVPPSKLALLHKAVMEACDARDGVKDGVLEDPRRCDFDPQALECKNGDTPACLTRAQVDAVRKFYAPLVNPRTNAQIFPGLERGGELLWGDSAATGAMVAQSRYGNGQWFRDAVFQDRNWDYRKFDFDRDLAEADRLDGGMMNNTEPNLRDFFKHGGKLLQYHGWADPGISPRNSVNYYKSVLDSMRAPGGLDGSYRLFMIPGMGHCSGGDGPTSFDPIPAIEQWVERGAAPDRIVASRRVDGKVDRTRPLCPYPQVAKYKGTGSTDDATNFVCTLP